MRSERQSTGGPRTGRERPPYPSPESLAERRTLPDTVFEVTARERNANGQAVVTVDGQAGVAPMVLAKLASGPSPQGALSLALGGAVYRVSLAYVVLGFLAFLIVVWPS
jgi:hypothetical protein